MERLSPLDKSRRNSTVFREAKLCDDQSDELGGLGTAVGDSYLKREATLMAVW